MKDMDLVDRIKGVVKQLEHIQDEGRQMTEKEKAEVQEVLLSIAEHRLKELGWDK